jgi:glutamate-1-semialdehyde 2,1-aminomutase
MAAGYAALKHIKDNPGIYKQLEEKSSYLEKGFKTNLSAVGKNYAMNRVGSMMCIFFTEDNVDDFKSAIKSDTILYGKYFHEMLKRGVYLAPAQFEALFVSTAHSKEDLDKTIRAHRESLEFILK